MCCSNVSRSLRLPEPKRLIPNPVVEYLSPTDENGVVLLIMQ